MSYQLAELQTLAYGFGYDSVGNRLFQTVNDVQINYVPDQATNELKSATSQVFTTNSAYDTNGNLVSRNATSTAHWTYSWGVPGNLLKVSNYTSVSGYYAYDGMGRRVEMKEGSTILFDAYLGTETLAEQDTYGAATDYIYASGLRIAKVTGYAANNPVVTFYHLDALGSTRLVTSSTGTVLFADNYMAFGQDNGTTGSETYKFTGKPVSQTTRL